MKIETGTTRRVLVFGRIVIKIAVFRLPDKAALNFVLKMGLYKYILRSKKYFPSNQDNFKFFEGLSCVLTPLYDGLASNLLEFIFYLKTRNKFLAPTYFSFLGLVNFQIRAEQAEIGRKEGNYPFNEIFPLVSNYYRNAPIEVVVPFCHHMLSESYGWDRQDRLVMFDYGSKSVFPFVLEKGEEIHSRYHRPSVS